MDGERGFVGGSWFRFRSGLREYNRMIGDIMSFIIRERPSQTSGEAVMRRKEKAEKE